MELIIATTGTVRGVYGEDIDLDVIGRVAIRRASHVEPSAAGGWTADLEPVGGPALGPFTKRSDALTAEAAWLNAHLRLLQTLPADS